MPTTIHCIRHGQGLHNLDIGHYDLPDPTLTPEGEAQCIALRKERFPDQSHISLIATSPMTRAIQSTMLIFQPAVRSSVLSKPVVAVPDAQETSDDPCDTGSDPQIVRKVCEENNWPIDLSLVQDGWNDKRIGGRYSPSAKAIARRAKDVRVFLRKQARDLIAAGDENPHIVLLAHGGFFHYFTEDWEDAYKRPGTGWVNCETRSYTLEHGIDDDNDVDASLVESTESRLRRGLEHPMFPKQTQRSLFDRAMQAWEDQGLQNPSKIGLSEEECDAVVKNSNKLDTTAKCIPVEA